MILFVVFYIVCAEPNLNPLVSGGSTLYDGQQISMTCTTEGSQVLHWISPEYIGSSNQLAVCSTDQVGEKVINSNVVVLVKSISNNRGVNVIVSVLTVTVSSAFPTFTVSCLNRDLNLNTSVTYITTSKYFSY